MPATKNLWTLAEVEILKEVYKDHTARKEICISKIISDLRERLTSRTSESLKSKANPKIDLDSLSDHGSLLREVPNRGLLIHEMPLGDRFLTSRRGERVRLFAADIVEAKADVPMSHDSVEYLLNISSRSWDSKYNILSISLSQYFLDKNLELPTKIRTSLCKTSKEHPLFIPILYKSHWTLAELGFERSSWVLRYYDSVFKLWKKDMESSDYPEGLALVVRGLSEVGIANPRVVWAGSPQQPENSTLCGGFVLKTCDAIARGHNRNFGANDVILLRNDLVRNAVNGFLLEESPGMETPHRLRNGDNSEVSQRNLSPDLKMGANELIDIEDNAHVLPQASSESAKRKAESPKHNPEAFSKKARSGTNLSAELSDLNRRLIDEKDELQVAHDNATKKLEISKAEFDAAKSSLETAKTECENSRKNLESHEEYIERFNKDLGVFMKQYT